VRVERPGGVINDYRMVGRRKLKAAFESAWSQLLTETDNTACTRKRQAFALAPVSQRFQRTYDTLLSSVVFKSWWRHYRMGVGDRVLIASPSGLGHAVKARRCTWKPSETRVETELVS